MLLDVPARLREPAHGGALDGVVPQDRDVDGGEGEVREQIHVGHGAEADARIVEPMDDELGRLFPDQLFQTFDAYRHGGGSLLSSRGNVSQNIQDAIRTWVRDP